MGDSSDLYQFQRELMNFGVEVYKYPRRGSP